MRDLIEINGRYISIISLYVTVDANFTAAIRDQFDSAAAAGSVDHTDADPGPGTRSVTDTESKLSIGS